MPTITTSGSKATITGPAALLNKISVALRKPITVGNEYAPTRICVPKKKLRVVMEIIKGEQNDRSHCE